MKRLLTLSLLLVTAVSPLHAAPTVQDFVGSFAPANWTTFPGDGSIAFSSTSLSLTSGNIAQESFTDVAIIVPFAVRVSFAWDYYTDDLPQFDVFGITTKSPSNVLSFILLSDLNGNNVQSGNFSMLFSAGDEFAFTARSTDGLNGAATTRVTNFEFEPTSVVVPEPSTLTLLFASLAVMVTFRRRWV